MGGVGGEIKRRREELGLSQPQAAVRAGIAVSALSQIENGKRSPNLGTLEKIADALSVEVRDLFPLGQASLPFEERDETILAEQRAQAFISAYPSEGERVKTLKRTADIINGYTARWRMEVSEVEAKGTFPYGRAIEMRTLWAKLSDAMDNDGVSDYIVWIETGRLVASKEERAVSNRVIDALTDMFNLVGRMHEIEYRNRERAGEEAKELERMFAEFPPASVPGRHPNARVRG